MKTLADFKRRLVPGLAVRVEFPTTTIHGNTQDSVFPARTVTRKVHSVSSSMLIWESEREPGKAGSRLDWPKADCLTFNGNAVAVAHEAGGKPFATYHFDA